MDFTKWNKAIDAEQFKKDIEELKNNSGDYPEIEAGEYVVKVEKMELKESSKGDPMLSIMFRILEGEHKKACIFYNQVLNLPFQIVNANKLLESMETDVEIVFNGDYSCYNNTVLDVFEAAENLEFLLDYGENNKGYKTFKILEVYDA